MPSAPEYHASPQAVEAFADHLVDVLNHGALCLMQDIRGSGQIQGDLDHPLGPFLYTISCMHCMPVSLARGGPGSRARPARA